MRLHRNASEKTIEFGIHGPWPGRRAIAVAAAGAVAALTIGSVALSNDAPPELMTIPPEPTSVLIDAEMAVARLEAALDAREPIEIQDAALELRARLVPLSPRERESVEDDAVQLLEQAERTIGELPPAPPATDATPGSGPGTVTPTTSTSSTPTTGGSTTTEPAPTTTSTTEPEPSTTTTEPGATTTTEAPVTIEEAEPPTGG
jgi:hypothetical protein